MIFLVVLSGLGILVPAAWFLFLASYLQNRIIDLRTQVAFSAALLTVAGVSILMLLLGIISVFALLGLLTS